MAKQQSHHVSPSHNKKHKDWVVWSKHKLKAVTNWDLTKCQNVLLHTTTIKETFQCIIPTRPSSDLPISWKFIVLLDWNYRILNIGMIHWILAYSVQKYLHCWWLLPPTELVNKTAGTRRESWVLNQMKGVKLMPGKCCNWRRGAIHLCLFCRHINHCQHLL